jgi:hypothetical protein
MQLEGLGSDALTMMATPTSTSMYLNDTSPLRMTIENNDGGTFKTMFLQLTNSNQTGGPMDGNEFNSTMKYIQFNASYTCRNTANDQTESYPLINSRNLTGGEHTVRATKWVIINKGAVPVCGTTNTNRAVLVEVLLWRD